MKEVLPKDFSYITHFNFTLWLSKLNLESPKISISISKISTVTLGNTDHFIGFSQGSEGALGLAF